MVGARPAVSGCVSRYERALLRWRYICFNGAMVGYQYIATGRSDLEPFWPSRQHHDFDRVCCGATIAPAL
ncbi:hypothetical protein NLX86_04820 [Streptomyces sp. A3M-1-3]|nr:hypothetical protein [Streptomyces sp. A3M-1-3]